MSNADSSLHRTPSDPDSPSYLIASLNRHLKDLSTFQIPRLAECSGPKTLQEELVAELREDMEELKKGMEALADIAEEQEMGMEKQSLLEQSKTFFEQYETVRHSYRRAYLTSSSLLRSSNHRRIHELNSVKSGGQEGKSTIGGSGSGSKSSGMEVDVAVKGRGEKKMSGRDRIEDPLQVKAHEVTDALRRTVDTMQQELEKSVMATQMLDESSQTLRSTQSLYDRYTSLLVTSAKLVRSIESADWYDRLIIFAALIFFCLVVAFIVKRRVLDKVVGGVGWWVGGTARVLTGRVGKKGVVGKRMGMEMGKGRFRKGKALAETLGKTIWHDSSTSSTSGMAATSMSRSETTMAATSMIGVITTVVSGLASSAAATPVTGGLVPEGAIQGRTEPLDPAPLLSDIVPEEKSQMEIKPSIATVMRDEL